MVFLELSINHSRHRKRQKMPLRWEKRLTKRLKPVILVMLALLANLVFLENLENPVIPMNPASPFVQPLTRRIFLQRSSARQ